MQKYLGYIILLAALIVLGLNVQKKLLSKKVTIKPEVEVTAKYASQVKALSYCQSPKEQKLCRLLEGQLERALEKNEGIRFIDNTFYLTLTKKSLLALIQIPDKIVDKVDLVHVIEKYFLSMNMDEFKGDTKLVHLSVKGTSATSRLNYQKILSSDQKLLKKAVHIAIFFNSKLRYNKRFKGIRAK